MGHKLKITGWIALGVMAGSLTTVSLQTVARGNRGTTSIGRTATTRQCVWHDQSDYVEPVDEKKLITDAISGMVSNLDPHSQYFDKKSFQEFREGTSGKFVGVGIEITQEDGLVKVVSPIEDSPAFRAGLKPNDLITRIDDTPVKGLTLNEAVKRMRGEPATRVLLTIFRKSENRTFPVTIIREEIKQQSVRGKVVEPGYAWVRVSQFQNARWKTSPRNSMTCTGRTQTSGVWFWTFAMTQAVCSMRPWPSQRCCPRTWTVVSTNGQTQESKQVLEATPAELRGIAGWRGDQVAACGDKERSAGCVGRRGLGLGRRDRCRRPARPQACHHHGQPNLGEGRCRRCGSWDLTPA